MIRLCICNVLPAEKAEEIEGRENRDQLEVNPSQQSASVDLVGFVGERLLSINSDRGGVFGGGRYVPIVVVVVFENVHCGVAREAVIVGDVGIVVYR